MQSDNFLKYLTSEKRYSPHTIVAYKTDICQFSEFLKNTFEIDKIEVADHQQIRSWIVDLMGKNTVPRSVNRKLTALKTFYKYLIRENIVINNPVKKVLSPKTSKKLPVFVEEKKMRQLEQIDFGSGFSAIRNKLIIELFYATGMRLSEMINMKENNIDTFNNSLKVLGKRNKERIIPFANSLRNIIKIYLAEKEKSGLHSDWFIVTGQGKKTYPKMIQRIVKDYLSLVTTVKQQSPHTLRHTFATHMLNNGADLNAIKELLGHANLSATQVYTHNSISKLTNVYKQAHPRA